MVNYLRLIWLLEGMTKLTARIRADGDEKLTALQSAFEAVCSGKKILDSMVMDAQADFPENKGKLPGQIDKLPYVHIYHGDNLIAPPSEHTKIGLRASNNITSGFLKTITNTAGSYLEK